VINKVSNLYNKLHAIESRTKRVKLYPIHKQLSLPNNVDIYDFLIEHYQLEGHMHILDAGCGVGYGSIKIAEITQATIKGISISSSEVQEATQNATKHQNNRCSFEVMSFTEVPPNTYDVIICVESLKHAIPIHLSVSSLMKGLKENGRLIVVDDFYTKNMNVEKAEAGLIKDWCLDKLIELEDLPNCSIKDITSAVQIKSTMLSKIQLMGLAMLQLFVTPTFTSLFRGGVYLDILYHQKKMKYLICEIKQS
jgi:cyclopropane fatty-acyl-phospholipid synthase-like methyltransferase